VTFHPIAVTVRAELSHRAAGARRQARDRPRCRRDRAEQPPRAARQRLRIHHRGAL